MNQEEKSAQYLDLNANERLLEIQQEIVGIEKKRLAGNLPTKEMEALKEKLKFLVGEERLIYEARYAKQKDIKDLEDEAVRPSITKEQSGVKEMIDREIQSDQKIEGELKEIIHATTKRMWYETWWGKLVVILLGSFLVSILSSGGDFTISLSDLFG